jgi:hypothetical protein
MTQRCRSAESGSQFLKGNPDVLIHARHSTEGGLIRDTWEERKGCNSGGRMTVHRLQCRSKHRRRVTCSLVILVMATLPQHRPHPPPLVLRCRVSSRCKSYGKDWRLSKRSEGKILWSATIVSTKESKFVQFISYLASMTTMGQK